MNKRVKMFNLHKYNSLKTPRNTIWIESCYKKEFNYLPNHSQIIRNPTIIKYYEATDQTSYIPDQMEKVKYLAHIIRT